MPHVATTAQEDDLDGRRGMQRLEHCSAGLFHCTNAAASFFTCAEYGAGDAATFEKSQSNPRSR
jgi:hypothetical protein